ncbi:MAG: hypothetical protein ACOCRK_05745 [bacterium]
MKKIKKNITIKFNNENYNYDIYIDDYFHKNYTNEKLAFKEYSTLVKKIKIQDLAYEIANLLSKHNYNGDTAIYFNEKRLQCYTTNSEDDWVLESGVLGSDYCKYAKNDTITMTFEGIYSIHDVINYYEPDKSGFLNEFEKLLKKYGYYYELGNNWNLALYEL